MDVWPPAEDEIFVGSMYEHSAVVDAMQRIVDACHTHKLVAGNPPATVTNHRRYRPMLSAPSASAA